MAKIKIRPSYDNSRTHVHASLRGDSVLELDVGEAFDMSSREIAIIEQDASRVRDEIETLRRMVRDLPDRAAAANALAQQAGHVASAAERIISERKWYSISLQGLLEAAKGLGEAASPLVGTCVKIVELLAKAKT